MTGATPSHPELRAALEALAAEPAEPARRTALLELLLSGSLLAIAVEDVEPAILCFTDEEAFGRMLPPAPPAVVRLPELWSSLTALGADVLAGASAVAASAWEAELIAGSQVEPVFARRSA